MDRYRKYNVYSFGIDTERRPIILARGVFNLRSLRNAIENDTSGKDDLQLDRRRAKNIPGPPWPLLGPSFSGPRGASRAPTSRV